MALAPKMALCWGLSYWVMVCAGIGNLRGTSHVYKVFEILGEIVYPKTLTRRP